MSAQTPDNPDGLTIIEYAIRYCVSRNSYAFEDGLVLAEKYWPCLSEATRADVLYGVRHNERIDLGRWPTIQAARFGPACPSRSPESGQPCDRRSGHYGSHRTFLTAWTDPIPETTAGLVHCVDAGHWDGYECPPDCPGVWPGGAYDDSTPETTATPMSDGEWVPFAEAIGVDPVTGHPSTPEITDDPIEGDLRRAGDSLYEFDGVEWIEVDWPSGVPTPGTAATPRHIVRTDGDGWWCVDCHQRFSEWPDDVMPCPGPTPETTAAPA